MTADLSLWAAFRTHELWQIIGLSLSVSLSASIAATLIGLPAGVALAIWRFRGQRVLIGAANALLGDFCTDPMSRRSSRPIKADHALSLKTA